jgi:hypothetical protein
MFRVIHTFDEFIILIFLYLCKFTHDVRKAMLYFLREEILDGENAYRCQR